MTDKNIDDETVEEAESKKEEAIFQLRAKHADAIVGELATESHQRPSDLFDKVKQRTDLPRSNFYNLLSDLQGTLLHKQDGPGNATLYSLTDLGYELANDFDLVPRAEEDTDPDYVIDLREVSAIDAIEQVIDFKEGVTIGDLEDLIPEKLRQRQNDREEPQDNVSGKTGSQPTAHKSKQRSTESYQNDLNPEDSYQKH